MSEESKPTTPPPEAEKKESVEEISLKSKPQPPQDLTLGLMKHVMTVVTTAISRGAFHPDELHKVGLIYEAYKSCIDNLEKNLVDNRDQMQKDLEEHGAKDNSEKAMTKAEASLCGS